MKTYTIKNPIKNIPDGMELNRRIYHLMCPKPLAPKIFKQFKSPSERLGVLRIIALIIAFQRQFGEGNNVYVNIDRNTLHSTAGVKYRLFLEWLASQNIIEINEQYSTGDKGYEPFTKSYKFTERMFLKPVVVIKWDTQELCATPDYREESKNECVFTPDGEYDAELLYCLMYEEKLSVPNADSIVKELEDKFIATESVEDATELCFASEVLHNINILKRAPREQSKSTRFYFNSIMMPTRYRKYLRYNGNVNLVNYDISAAYPAFIKIMAVAKGRNRDKEDKGTYVFSIFRGTTENFDFEMEQFYKKDFYTELQKDTNYNTRDEVKKAFNAYRNSSTDIKQKHIFTKRLIEMGEEGMVDVIMNTTWKDLELIETEVMVALCDYCIDKELMFIRQHDGFLTIPQDVEEIEALLSKSPFSILKWKKETYE